MTTERLRELAEAATSGPWSWTDGENYSEDRWDYAYLDPMVLHGAWHNTGDAGVGVNAADAAYIAAVDPQTVLRLLDDKDRLRAALETIEALHAEGYCGCRFQFRGRSQRYAYPCPTRQEARAALEER